MTGTNGLAGREELLGATQGKRRFKGGDDDPGDPIILPVAGMRVRIRSLTEGEVSRWQQQAMAKRGTRAVPERIADANRRLIALCMVDGQGNVLLKPGDTVRLSEWDSKDSVYLADECNRHCGLDPEDLEALVKNSGETHAASSPTSSPDSADGST